MSPVTSLLDDAESIAIRVGKNHVVGILGIAPLDLLRAETEQPFDFGGLVVGIQVQMVALACIGIRRNLSDCQLWSWSLHGHQYCPISRGFAQWSIVQGCTPEGDGARNIAHAPHD